MWPTAAGDAVCAYCRHGMEDDCAAELVDRGAALGVGGWCRALPGRVEFHPGRRDALETLARGLRFDRLVFVRQWFTRVARLSDLPAAGRAAPIAAALASHVARFADLRVEYPDTPEGRPLARLARALQRPLEAALERSGMVRGGDGPVVHCLLTAGRAVELGLSDPANAAAWPLGIPRLRAPRRAPSRSMLKLEEAITLFLSEAERAAWLRPGRTGVDLGAAPGGWTWLLRRRGLGVTAVDNGPLAPELEADPGVEHRAEDGFRYRPPGPVDWLLCDMVERPHRIARLTAGWLERGDCRHAIVNLKLPMERRWRAAAAHLETVAASLPAHGRLGARQLYHDRDEITVFATRAGS